MNYLRIRLILSIYKALYSDSRPTRQTPHRTSHTSAILKHGRILRRLTNCLIDISPDLTIEEKRTIEQDYVEVLIAIYDHF